MDKEKLKRRKVIVSNSIIPWFIGLSDDLMFFIVINTLFFTQVKGFSAAQISFLSTISGLSYIFLQMPALKIIKKIGNLKSVWLGTIMLLSSSIIMTFGKNYYIVLLGYIIYTTAFMFKRMEHVILENNLRYLNKENKYIKISSKAHTLYSIITTIIALIAGKIFAYNHYLPMYLCISICVLNVLLSFCIYDVGEENKKQEEKEINKKIKFSKIVKIIFISFGLMYAIIDMGQNNSKLFIQYNLNDHFSIENTATYLSLIIVTSRIARIIGNLCFNKIHNKLKDKVNIIFPIMAIIAFILVSIGGCINFNLIIKFILMMVGFDIILLIRDPVDVYTTNLMLKNTSEEQKQKAVSYMQLSRRIGNTIISLMFSLLLIKIDLSYIILLLLVLAFIGLIVNIKLYKMTNQKSSKT